MSHVIIHNAYVKFCTDVIGPDPASEEDLNPHDADPRRDEAPRQARRFT
ncbi:hypothetical protein [Tessaracoccus antarcticus]|nr:hypothetical protein [Tessaracoccus antarcticus]